MYGNFIYFILVLLIYTTYYPPEKPYLGALQTLILFLMLLAVFVGNTQARFRTLSKKIDLEGPTGQHGQFDRLFTQQAIMAIVMFSINIYVLNLKLFVVSIPVFSVSPTMTALLFVLLFVAHLAIIWAIAYKPYQRLFRTKVSRRAYVLSNISFDLPVILPWLLISAGIDIINLLPFETPKHFLATPEGQVIFFFCFLSVLIVVAPSLIKFFWQCHPLPPGPKRERIEAMCRKAKLGYNNILRWPIFDGRLLTAGVMGVMKRFRYILVTEGLLKILNDDEIDAVMAHEIGHVQRKHLIFYLIFFLGFIVLSYAVFDLILYAIVYYGNLVFPIQRTPWAEPSTLTSVFFTVAMAATLLVYFRYVFGYFMRNCERQADLHAFSLLENSQGLVSSLEKIAVYSGKAHDRPSWHHFSIRQRIDFLNKCETDRRWIARHDRKLRRSVMVFVAGLLSIGYLGYAVNFGEMGRALNSHFIERVLVKEISRNPTNSALYFVLATIQYENKTYGSAIKAYEKSIELAPRNAEALNNLAWIYATCEEVEYRDAEKALFYAKQAAALNPAPHILDTLAESYYVNSLHQEAIMTIKQALAMSPQDRDYYENQLKKFKETAIEEFGN